MRLFFSSLILISIFTLQVSAGAFDTVVIDAGHGGRDNGGSYGKVYEKWLALDTAIRVFFAHSLEVRWVGLAAALLRRYPT